MAYPRNENLVRRISYHDSRREILPSAGQRNAKARKTAKFENKNMAAACSAAVVSIIEELTGNSELEEASSFEDDEFLFFLLIDSKERKSHVRIDNYTTLQCFRFSKSFSDVKNYSQLFGTPFSCLSRSAA